MLEAHLFGFDGDLYGEWVRIEWVERLRDIERFDSVEQLQKQLQRDRAQALAALGRANAPLIEYHPCLRAIDTMLSTIRTRLLVIAGPDRLSILLPHSP